MAKLQGPLGERIPTPEIPESHKRFRFGPYLRLKVSRCGTIDRGLPSRRTVFDSSPRLDSSCNGTDSMGLQGFLRHPSEFSPASHLTYSQNTSARVTPHCDRSAHC